METYWCCKKNSIVDWIFYRIDFYRLSISTIFEDVKTTTSQKHNYHVITKDHHAMKIINGLIIIALMSLLIVSGCVSNENTQGTPPIINNAGSVVSPDHSLKLTPQTIINNAGSVVSPDQPLNLTP
jgi:hypothetical protein